MVLVLRPENMVVGIDVGNVDAPLRRPGDMVRVNDVTGSSFLVVSSPVQHDDIKSYKRLIT